LCQRKEVIVAEVSASKAKSVVLVHGGFVDGSGWEGVYKILKKVCMVGRGASARSAWPASRPL
jgi:hypothetical protein